MRRVERVRERATRLKRRWKGGKVEVELSRTREREEQAWWT